MFSLNQRCGKIIALRKCFYIDWNCFSDERCCPWDLCMEKEYAFRKSFILSAHIHTHTSYIQLSSLCWNHMGIHAN